MANSSTGLGKPERLVIGGCATVFYIVVAWCVVWLVWFLFIHKDPGLPVTFEASVTDYGTSGNPAYLDVTIKVKNTGTQAGIASCTVSAHDDSGKYTGADYVRSPDRVEPGASMTFTGHIYISLGGSLYVTHVSVDDCI